MGKLSDVRRFLNSESGPRKVLFDSILPHIGDIRLQEALKLRKMERNDAIEQVVKDAVRRTPIVSFSGIPHVYDSEEGIYISFDYHDFKLSLYDVMRAKDIPNGCYSYIEKMVKLCWSECQTRKALVNTTVVVMSNGVYDTLDGRMHSYSNEYLTNMKVNYAFNPNEDPLRWKRFLNEVLPDKQMQNLLQEFVAMAYVDRTIAKLEKMLILLGKGSNGKSVVFETIQSLLGEGNITNFSIADLISAQRREQNIALCNGKRMNYCSEIRTTEIGEKNADAFKSLVSGEAQMARSLFHEPFRATEIPIIMANANKLPRLSDATFAMERRMIVIPFDTFISEEKQDVELSTTLKGELSGIFNWMLEGLKRLRSNDYKLTIPDSIRQIVRDYMTNNDSISRWIDARSMFANWHPQTNAQPEWRETTVLYRDYVEYCKIEGFQPKPQKEFMDHMKNANYELRRHSCGNGFVFYHTPTVEEIRALNMDIAIGMQSNEYVQALRAAAENSKRITVEGVEDLEKYLGLPKDCIWPYIQSGALDKAFTSTRAGRMTFDVQTVQIKLAEVGFYSELKSDTNSCKRRATGVLKGMRQSFNSKMRTMGVPIRKYGNVYGYVPVGDKDCYIVPDDWEYTPKAAEVVLSQRKENLQIIKTEE